MSLLKFINFINQIWQRCFKFTKSFDKLISQEVIDNTLNV